MKGFLLDLGQGLALCSCISNQHCWTQVGFAKTQSKHVEETSWWSRDPCRLTWVYRRKRKTWRPSSVSIIRNQRDKTLRPPASKARDRISIWSSDGSAMRQDLKWLQLLKMYTVSRSRKVSRHPQRVDWCLFVYQGCRSMFASSSFSWTRKQCDFRWC